jgi:hypothetical protein
MVLWSPHRLHGKTPDVATGARAGGLGRPPATLRLLTKTKQPELHRYWTTRDRAANIRLYRQAADILAAVDAGMFPPRVGWHGQDCPVRSRCWAWE